jgi:hypothetical protein
MEIKVDEEEKEVLRGRSRRELIKKKTRRNSGMKQGAIRHRK